MGLKAHIGFSIPETSDVELKIISHFSALGYRVVEQQHLKWVFQRGGKLASLFRFDIRAYATTLVVETGPSQSGETWISCDWEVWLLMAVATGADIGTLEAEGRQLESVLRRQVGEGGVRR
jgi:hypothetical protein